MTRPALSAVPATTDPWTGEPMPLHALAAGTPVHLPSVDLMHFANSTWQGLDPLKSPDEHTAAEVALDYFHRHVGTERRTKGDRALALASSLARYLLPFLIETELARPSARRGVGHLSVLEAERLPVILSGAQALPAATVAADLLGGKRTGLTAIWLTRQEAEQVTTDLRLLHRAIAGGQLPTHHDPSGQPLVLAADLRAAGLLTEPDEPHGLQPGTAKGHLGVLADIVSRARDLGAGTRGNFKLRAITPLPDHSLNEAKGERVYRSLEEVALLCTQLHPTHQVVLWLMRLLGLRIGEVFGLLVEDFTVEDGTGWLQVSTQGGQLAWVRNSKGHLVRAQVKDHTKTPTSTRTIPLPAHLTGLLCRYVDIYHRRHDTGELDTGARLVAGLRAENDSGIAAFRCAVDTATRALAATGHEIAPVEPHDMRASLITDLTDLTDRRHRRWYVGHVSRGDEHEHYDLGPRPPEFLPVAAQTQQLLCHAGFTGLLVPTSRREQWGRGTRRHRERALITQTLREMGWLVARGETTAPAVQEYTPEGASRSGPPTVEGAWLEVNQVAQRLSVSASTARRWMREGRIRARQRTWGARTVWLAHEADVEGYLSNRQATTTLTELAAQTGWTYHQLYQRLSDCGRLEDRAPGTAVELSQDDVDFVLRQIEARGRARHGALRISAAARILNLPEEVIGTLIRRGILELADVPASQRGRYVTRDSVLRYAESHPSQPPAADDEMVVPRDVAAEVLRMTRHELTDLVLSRRLRTVSIKRRQFFTLSSVLNLRENWPPEVEDLLRTAATPQP